MSVGDYYIVALGLLNDLNGMVGKKFGEVNFNLGVIKAVAFMQLYNLGAIPADIKMNCEQLDALISDPQAPVKLIDVVDGWSRPINVMTADEKAQAKAAGTTFDRNGFDGFEPGEAATSFQKLMPLFPATISAPTQLTKSKSDAMAEANQYVDGVINSFEGYFPNYKDIAMGQIALGVLMVDCMIIDNPQLQAALDAAIKLWSSITVNRLQNEMDNISIQDTLPASFQNMKAILQTMQKAA